MTPILNADVIEAFAGTFLSPRFDGACPTPAFHREAWALYASPAPQVVVIAPRDHAKSTALTVAYTLAEVLFRQSSYVIIIGSTEENAGELIGNIADHLIENEDVIEEFGPFTFGTQSKTDIIVRFPDGHRFRILARGAEQRIRGKMWNGKRPDLIVADDLEDDEQVENRDRRVKFRKWFFRAAKQALSINGRIRIHGTVLHEDSLLARLRKNRMWENLFFKAHASYDDFSDILWPARWDEFKLRSRQREFIEDQDPSGYAQEFLNDPQDSADAYLRKEDFLPMSPDDFDRPMVVCVAGDFAVSVADKANRTSFTIGGKDESNILHFLDQRVGRWDTLQWVDEMFLIQQRWDPAVFWVEDGVIWLGIAKIIYREMTIRNIFINIVTRKPIKDKGVRGRSLQRRMRAGAARFNRDTDWYPGFEAELLKFTGTAASTLDDQFDSAALLSLGFEDLAHFDRDDFKSEEEERFEREDPRVAAGRSTVTGY